MTKEKICGIYCIENLVNSKKYIGQSVDIYDREYHHFNSLKNGTHYNEFLQHDYDVYKKDNFIFYIVIECQEDELDYYEILYIEEFNLMDKNIGYNVSPGGAHPHEFSEIELKKRSESIKKKWEHMDIETKEHIIAALQNGYKRWAENATKEQKEEMYEKRRITIRKKLKDEIDEINKKRANSIRTSIKNRTKERQQEVVENYKKSSKKRWDNTPNDVKEALRQTVIKSVYCPQLDMVFESIKEASLFTSTQPSNIVNVCRGKRNYAGKLDDGTKLTWSYIT